MEKSLELSKNLIKRKIGDLEYFYGVERRHIKYPRLEFKSINELLVVLPIENSNEIEFLEKKEKWISKKLKKINEALELIKEYKAEIKDKILFLGKFYELMESEGNYNVELNNNEIEIMAPSQDLSIKYLKDWLKEELKEIIILNLNNYSKELGISYNRKRVFIRLQNSKWASCTSKNTLNFNLKLICLPEELINYVILHELTHLRKMKHNTEFWKIISNFFPEFKENELQLLGFWFLIEENKFWRMFKGFQNK